MDRWSPPKKTNNGDKGGIVGHLVVLKVVEDSANPYAVQYIAAKGQSFTKAVLSGQIIKRPPVLEEVKRSIGR